MNRRPLPISEIPRNSPAWLILFAPNDLRHADHRSCSFFRRMKRLKLMPQTTSLVSMKFSVEKGMATVAVQPCEVMRASEIHTPSHPGSPSLPSSCGDCSSVNQSVALRAERIELKHVGVTAVVG